MLRVRYTFKYKNTPLTVQSLSELQSNEMKSAIEERLVEWSQSLRDRALRYRIEQQTNRQVAENARIHFDSSHPNPH